MTEVQEWLDQRNYAIEQNFGIQNLGAIVDHVCKHPLASKTVLSAALFKQEMRCAVILSLLSEIVDEDLHEERNSLMDYAIFMPREELIKRPEKMRKNHFNRFLKRILLHTSEEESIRFADYLIRRRIKRLGIKPEPLPEKPEEEAPVTYQQKATSSQVTVGLSDALDKWDQDSLYGNPDDLDNGW